MGGVRKVLFVLLMLCTQCCAQAARMLFSHYTVEDGLGSNTVNGVCQDADGFIWMATHYGVSRFDGAHFKNFNSSTDSVVVKNDLNYAFVLPNGKPSFSSSNAVLFSYDKSVQSFVDISSFLPENKFKYDVKGFSVQHDGVGLLATACGIYQYNTSQRRFERVAPKYLDYVLDVCTDVYGRYWVGTFQGLHLLDKEGNLLSAKEWEIQSGGMVNEIFFLDKSHMLLGSSVGNLCVAEFNDATALPVLKKLDVPFKYVLSIVADNTGTLWMGTMSDGLWKCRFNDGKLSYEKVVPLNEPEDALSKISSLFIDRDGNVWVSTVSSGVWRTASVSDFAYVKSKDFGIPVSVGAAFCETENGDILMGTDGMGLYLLGSDFQVKRLVDGLSANSVLTIEKDGDDYLIGYWGGETNRYNPVTNKLSKVVYNGIGKPLYTTKNIMRTADGVLYVSAAGDGIYKGEKGKWERLPLRDTSMNNYPDMWFEGSYLKSDGSIRLYSARTVWSNLGGEFHAIMPDADKTKASDPRHANHCVANADGELFVTTNLGIYAFTNTDSALGRLEYLPAGEYASAVVDAKGRLWTSGSNGILSVDTKQKTYECVVPVSDIPSADYFTSRACVQTSNGMIFFGCKDGFICVQPNFQRKEKVEYLAFSQLSVHGVPVPCGSDLLPQPLSGMKVLDLDYSQTHITVGFDVVDFSLVNKLGTRFRIPELDTAWTDLGQKREIDITYLPSGNFTIELACYSGSQMVEKTALAIRVLPPWWKSWWFTCLVVLAVALALYGVYCARMRRVVEYRRELEREVAERTRDLNDANLQLENHKQQIEAQNSTLLATLKQKDQLVSVVAHDLKNPMFAIVSTLKRMVANVYVPAEQQRLLTKLADESDGLQKQMVNLLQWATEDDGLLACRVKPVDANALISDALSLLKGLAGEKDIELRAEGKTLFATMADSRMFSTVVRNLVTNAIKFSEKGSTVSVCLSETDDTTVMKVVDEGVGMPQQKIDELLSGQNVVSTSGTEKEEGFGFGFKIVLDYIHKNNGSIQIESQAGCGTSISVLLPKCADVRLEDEVVADSVAVGVTVNAGLLTGKRVLVVDDDELLLEHISSLLSPYVEVLRAHDGEQGFAMALQNIPDLIVSDVDMPNMNGMEMYGKLMDNILTSNIPLLFLSAKNDSAVRQRGLSIGAIDYIAKPFADGELLAKICNFLSWQQKQQLKVLSQSLEGRESEQSEAINPLLEKIVNLVKENYANPLYSLTDIVKEMGMSKATLSRRLKSITDKTPMEILTEYRLNLAKKLLADGDKSVSDVAYAVGFNDPSYFSRRFKEIFGTSPKSAR